MSRLGADPEALRELGGRLRRAAATLDETTIGLERQVRAAGWRGPDAERFVADWQRQHRPTLARCAEQFRSTSSRLDRQAEDQMVASGADPTGPAIGLSVVAAVGAGGAGALPRSAAALPRPDAAPDVELQIRAGSEVTAGSLVVGLGQDLSIRQLPADRSLLTATGTRRGGVSLVFGAAGGVRIDGSGAPQRPTLSAAGDAKVTVAQVTRQQYLVDDDDVISTIGRLAAEQALHSAGDATRQLPGLGAAQYAIGPATEAWGWIADRLTDTVPGLGDLADGVRLAPAPTRVETLAELAVSGALGVSIAGAAGMEAGAELSGTIRLGDATIDGRRESRILEMDGTVASTLQGTLADALGLDLPDPRPLEAALRIEVPERRVDGVDLIVTMSTSDGTTVHQSTSHVALVGHTVQAASQLDAALGQLADGDAARAFETVSRLDLRADAVATRTSALRVSNHSLGADALVGQGIGVGLVGEGGVRRLDRIG